jgi:hypothetical protein
VTNGYIEVDLCHILGGDRDHARTSFLGHRHFTVTTRVFEESSVPDIGDGNQLSTCGNTLQFRGTLDSLYLFHTGRCPVDDRCPCAALIALIELTLTKHLTESRPLAPSKQPVPTNLPSSVAFNRSPHFAASLSVEKTKSGTGSRLFSWSHCLPIDATGATEGHHMNDILDKSDSPLKTNTYSGTLL